MLTTLNNGLRVIIQENRSAPVVALQMWVDVGSADDPPAMAGLAHVLEHMVFKGTAKRGVGDIAKEIEGAGGDINAWTSFDQTVYHIVMASRFFDRGLDVLADTMQNTSIDPEELSRELSVVLEEIAEGVDAPSRVVSRELFGSAYRAHPYGRPVIGYVDTVKSMRPQRVAELFRRHYTPHNMTLVIVGDVDRKAALTRVRRAFARKRKRARIQRRPPEPRQRRLRLKVVRQQTQETHVAIGFHIPELAHADTPAIDLAALILGQGDVSRLVKRVRRELRLATDVYAYAYSPREPGLLLIGATTPPDRAVDAVREITREVVALGRLEVSEAELRRAQTVIESDAVYQKETVQGQARKLGFYQSVAGDLGFEQEYNRRIAAVTATGLREVAGRYLTADNMTVAIVASKEGAPSVAELRQAVTAGAKSAGRASVAVVGKARDERVTRVRLANGARLVFLRDSSVPLLAMRAAFKGGLRYETTTNGGINNLLAALVTRGTNTRGADEIHGQIEDMAGSIRRLLGAQQLWREGRAALPSLGAGARAGRRLRARSGL